ncbi:MAG: TonB-dependent receptor [Bacteroidia bacterium]|nr:TonB-dependent receptor [Bacteroidia bacterium]
MNLLRTLLIVLFSSMMLGLSAQTRIISGEVIDKNSKEPIPGVYLRTQSGNASTATDVNGKFSLKNPAGNTIMMVSYIGYKSQTISVQGKSIVNILLEEDAKGLDEVVVVGYATQKKESVVGSISQVKGADLMKAGVPSVANALTGRVPGLITVQQSGLPGSNDSKVYIRGMSSFTGSSAPLVLVDGVESSMNDINPSEVENISVLKDASATAVFGVKGANGVILITTKRGQEGKMEIAVTYDQTMKQATISGIQDNAYNALVARNSLYRNRNTYNLVLGDEILEHYRIQDMPYVYPDIDTWNYNVKDFAMDTQASISARGGTANAKYFLTLSYLHEGDIVKDNQTLYDPSYKYDRVNYRMNFDFSLSKTTTLSISSGGYVGTDSHGGDYGVPAKVLSNMLVMPPYMTPYTYSEEFVRAHPSNLYPEISSRLAGSLLPSSNRASIDYIHNQQGTVKSMRDRLTTDINLDQKLDFITKGLKTKLSLNYNNESTWRGGGYAYYGEYYIYQPMGDSYEWLRYVYDQQDNYKLIEKPYQSAISQYGAPIKSLKYSAQIDYARSFGKHNVSALGVFSRRNSQSGASFPHFEENWVARATYDYDSRYLFEANLGIAGSEQFAPANRFGFFPAVALGWNIAKESFIKDQISQINNLKMRFSYGEGGYDGTDGFLYLSEYTNWSSYAIGTAESRTNINSLKEGSAPNVNARWERSIKRSLGLDIGLFSNTLTGSIDLFDENRDDILMTRRSVSDIFGQTMNKMNVGSTKKHGYEMEVGYNNKVGAFYYWLKGNYNFNENRITSMDDPAFTLDYLKSEGKPIGATFSSKNIGYYQDMDEILNYSLGQNNLIIGGDKALDFNGDATTSNDAVAMAYSNRPNKSYSFSAGFEYKNFDFNFMLQGVTQVSKSFGNYTTPMWTYDPGDFYILLKGQTDVWSPENRDAKYANWGASNATSNGIVDASYLRLKSMELGYTLRGRTLKSLGLNSARLAFQGSNLLTIAPGYKLGDPENEGSVDYYGGSYAGSFQFYPLPRRFTLSVKLNF